MASKEKIYFIEQRHNSIELAESGRYLWRGKRSDRSGVVLDRGRWTEGSGPGGFPMTEVSRVGDGAGVLPRRWRGVGLLLAIGPVWAASCTEARADAFAASSGKLFTTPDANARFTGGQGGSAATSYLGNAAGAPAMADPGAAGMTFDDLARSNILDPAGKGVQAVPPASVTGLGKGFKSVYAMPKLSNIEAGEALRYNVMTTPDKIADAKANKPPLTSTSGVLTIGKNTAESTATQATVLNANKINGTLTGTATAEVMKDPAKPEVGFAAAVVHDPLVFAQNSPGSSATLFASIASGFELRANLAGDFAGAFFDLETDRDGTLFNFSIQIDSTTTTLSASNFVVNAETGYADSNAFINQFLLPSFQISNHDLTLANPGDLLLPTGSSLTVIDGTPLAVTYTYGAFAGTVPEPSSLILLAIGGLAIALHARNPGRSAGVRRRLVVGPRSMAL